ncbi:Golgi-associated kinase 1A-like [Stegostoma tigrinum]|uniref:Golgi-associated kinase 1A-like n=1 Tax=Stegostoma tigrinum TaxID=3053191 RepID=UPI00202AC4DD|nr:Golgi-associated kinase 1A-like [Stegostoma tigrinum]XP_059507526.1 Golgi-associated kinase 1A-like [Stegostoma tigrinum]XP_059507527.1 Golgi-associated kinase 1A-like [Stegostoma tigrinum]
MRLNKKRVLLCVSLLGSVYILLCTIKTLDVHSAATASKSRVQETEQVYTRTRAIKGKSVHPSDLQQQRKFKLRDLFLLDSVQIIESNLHQKASKPRPFRKSKSKDSTKWLGDDNEIVGAPRDEEEMDVTQKSAKKNNVASSKKQEAKKLKEAKKPARTNLECLRRGRLHSEDFLGGPALEKPITWFSQRDKRLVHLLARGFVQKVDHFTRGEEMARVVLSINSSRPLEGSRDRCREGVCGIVKEMSDLREVAAFHLDRILGLGISQPVVTRRLQCPLLPVKYTNGSAKPVVWWDPEISLPPGMSLHLDMYLFHVAQFPSVFRQCGALQDEICFRDNSPELEKLKLLDYFFQDVEVILNSFGKGRDRRAVNLNDLEWLSPNILKTIASQCLPEMLLRSLHKDQEYWQSKGLSSLMKLVDKVDKRAQALLKYVQEHKARPKKTQM